MSLGLGSDVARQTVHDADILLENRPRDIVEFSNLYFPLNLDSKRPMMGPEMPKLTSEWLNHWVNHHNGGIIGPPGYTKTATVERIILYTIAFDHNSRGAYVTRTDKKALNIGKVIQERIEKNVKFQNDYGVYPDYTKWSKSEFIIKRSDTSKEPTFQVTGTGGQFESARLNYIILDDITDKRSLRSKAEWDMVKDFFDTTAMQRLDPGGWIFFIGSRWSPHDIYGHMKKLDFFRDPVTGESTILEYKAEPVPGRSLSEEIYPYELLMEKKRAITPSSFLLRYQQEAAGTDNKPFDSPGIVDHRYIVEHGIWFRFFGMDLNVSERKESNLTAVTFFTVLKNRQIVMDSLYTTHIKKHYESYLADCIIQSSKGYYPIPKIGWIENFGFQESIIEDIRESFQTEDQYKVRGFDHISIQGWGRKKKKKDIPEEVGYTYQDLKKEERIVAVLEPLIRSGQLLGYSDEDYPRYGSQEIIDNIDSFPDVEFYDPLDSGAIGLINIRPYLMQRTDGQFIPKAYRSRPKRR